MQIAPLDSRNRGWPGGCRERRPGAVFVAFAMVGMIVLCHPDLAWAQTRASVQVGAQVLSIGPVAEGLQAVGVVLGTTIAVRRQIQTRLATVLVHRGPAAAAAGTGPRDQPVEVHFLRN